MAAEFQGVKFAAAYRIAALAAVCAVAASSAESQSYRVTSYGVERVLPGAKALPPGPPSEVVAAHGLTWNLYYEDLLDNSGIGFDSASAGALRRERVADCLIYIADVLNESGELDVVVGESFDSPENPPPGSFLARGGTGFDCGDGFSSGWAYERIRTGVKSSPGEEDIFIQFNFDFNFHAGTISAPSGTYDLQTVLLHEFTHGLGLLGLSDQNGQSLLEDCAEGDAVFTVWDSFLQRGAPQALLFGGPPPEFQGSPSDLVSADLYFSGPQCALGYGQAGQFAGVYAPGFFALGSSCSHFATGEIAGGPAVMEHAIPSGRTLRRYKPLEIGALRDLGYGAAADPFAPGCDGLGGEPDVCGECRGDGSTCLGCDGVPASGVEFDDCGVCGGNGVACYGIDGRGGYYEEGDRFELHALGPEGTYTWLRDGEPIASGPAKTFVIPSLSIADSGDYRVRVDYGTKAALLSAAIPIEVVATGSLPMSNVAAGALLCLLAAVAVNLLRAQNRLFSWYSRE